MKNKSATTLVLIHILSIFFLSINVGNSTLINTNQEKSGRFKILMSSSTVRSPVFASSIKSAKDEFFSLPTIARSEQKKSDQQSNAKIDENTKLILQQFSNSYLGRATHRSIEDPSFTLNESSIAGS